MARIRSVHPGLFTDEAFVSCSPMARLLLIGLWTEADDQGVFEWKPLTLKMRLLPADNADAAELLDEVATNGIVQRFEVDGKAYGAIRNFRKYQRPKRPNEVHPLPPEFRTYVGLTDDCSEHVPPKAPTRGGKSPQMEDGGGRREDGDSSVSDDTDAEASHDPVKVTFDAGVRLLTRGGQNERQARSLIGRWRKDHGDAAVFDAMARAQRAQASEPVSFIMALLKSRDGPLNANGLVIPDLTNA